MQKNLSILSPCRRSLLLPLEVARFRSPLRPAVQSSAYNRSASFLASVNSRHPLLCVKARRLQTSVMPVNKRLSQIQGHLDVRHSSSQAANPGAIITSTISDIPGHDGKVATITVSNPKKLNIVNSALLDHLQSEFSALSSEPDLRVVILTGATSKEKSPAFIGGADIKEMAAIETPDQARAFITKIHQVCEAIRTCPVPVIARIDGFCLGAGLEIMAACDLRVATKGSTFGMPEVKVGIPSVVEARLLVDLVGWGRARRLIYLAENVNAETAVRWGLVEEMCDTVDRLDRVVNEWTARIADNGPKAMRSQKKLISRWEECDVKEGINAGKETFAESWEDGGKEPKALMGKFLHRKN